MLKENMDRNDDLFFTWYINSGTNSKEVDLCKDGSKVLIKEHNKKLFVSKVVDLITYDSIKDRIDPFITGFRSIIPSNIIEIFTVEELDFLVSGQSTIDVKDWKSNTIYKGTFNENDNVNSNELYYLDY